MELLVVIGLLGALAIASALWGYDSRDCRVDSPRGPGTARRFRPNI